MSASGKSKGLYTMTINNDTPNTASDEGDEADEGDLISLSAEYSAQLSLGGNPDFADWLQRVSPDRQESLVRRLKSVAAASSLETPDDVGH